MRIDALVGLDYLPHTTLKEYPNMFKNVARISNYNLTFTLTGRTRFIQKRCPVYYVLRRDYVWYGLHINYSWQDTGAKTIAQVLPLTDKAVAGETVKTKGFTYLVFYCLDRDPILDQVMAQQTKDLNEGMRSDDRFNEFQRQQTELTRDYSSYSAYYEREAVADRVRDLIESESH